MVGESNKNVLMIQIDVTSFAEFKISEFEISRFDCSMKKPVMELDVGTNSDVLSQSLPQRGGN